MIRETHGLVKDLTRLNREARVHIETKVVEEITPIVEKWSQAIHEACSEVLDQKVRQADEAFRRWFQILTKGSDRNGPGIEEKIEEIADGD